MSAETRSLAGQNWHQLREIDHMSSTWEDEASHLPGAVSA